MNISNKWLKNYELAKAFFEQNGTLLIPQDYISNDVKLGHWISNQRNAYKGIGSCKITETQIQMLESIGMVWDAKEAQWYNNYKYAKEFYEKNGNLLIQNKYTTPDGIKLGYWISNQRNAYKGSGTNKLNDKQIELLNQIDMIWNVNEMSWFENYELAKEFYKENGHLLVPSKYIAKNNVNLGYWISTQRQTYKGLGKHKITEKQIHLLNKIKMVWDAKEVQWFNNYDLAKEFYKENNHLVIPQNYVTKDGVKLGRWISTQRQVYKGKGVGKLTQEQIDLLNKLHMVWVIK